MIPQTLAEKVKAYACYEQLFAQEKSSPDYKRLLRDPVLEPPVSNYVDAITECLLTWLYAMSGVPWVRGFEDGPRPEGQYGTVCITQVARVEGCDTAPALQKYKGDLLETVCKVRRFTVQLDVYRDSGVSANCEEDVVNTRTLPHGSALDVLNWLSVRMEHQVHRDALCEKGLEIDGEGIELANSNVLLRQHDAENRATADLFIFGTIKSTMRVPAVRALSTRITSKETPDGVVTTDKTCQAKEPVMNEEK